MHEVCHCDAGPRFRVQDDGQLTTDEDWAKWNSKYNYWESYAVPVFLCQFMCLFSSLACWHISWKTVGGGGVLYITIQVYMAIMVKTFQASIKAQRHLLAESLYPETVGDSEVVNV